MTSVALILAVAAAEEELLMTTDPSRRRRRGLCRIFQTCKIKSVYAILSVLMKLVVLIALFALCSAKTLWHQLDSYTFEVERAGRGILQI